jgi:valyl-tRNA synthetase
LNAEGARVGEGFEGEPASWPLHDRWIVSRLHKATRDVGRAIEAYQFHEAVYALYHFFWDDFCDWYIELSKADVTAAEATPARGAARSRLFTVLEQALRLLHPFMPFITEELWQRLPGVGADSLHAAYRGAGVTPTVMLTPYPQADESLIDERAEAEMRSVIELVSRVRNIRTELSVKPGDRLPSIIVGAGPNGLGAVFGANLAQIKRLTRAGEVTFSDSLADAPRASARAVLAGGVEVVVPLEGLVDFEKERERLARDEEKLEKEAQKLEAQLANPQFVERAPSEKVEELRQRLADVRQRIKALGQMREALGE